ncbi:MAG: glycosyltransferase [Candidatus Omnitrophica bacterium]|nr:glycosyltransferase [Candidatus Omnitrophota bacterium]
MKVSIITVVLNRASTISYCIESILAQRYPDIEYIIIDGGSKDGTVEIINKYKEKISKFISDKDEGIYYAMNKGIRMASGDIIGFLNSDDFYINERVIERIVKEFQQKKVESVYADLIIVSRNDINRIVRYYDSSIFNPKKFAFGWMPAHPTFFVKRKIYEKFGLFKTDYKIAADFELVARFLWKYRISYSYIPAPIIKMRAGGTSNGNIKKHIIGSKEILRACRENNIKTNIINVNLRFIEKLFSIKLI